MVVLPSFGNDSHRCFSRSLVKSKTFLSSLPPPVMYPVFPGLLSLYFCLRCFSPSPFFPFSRRRSAFLLSLPLSSRLNDRLPHKGYRSLQEKDPRFLFQKGFRYPDSRLFFLPRVVFLFPCFIARLFSFDHPRFLLPPMTVSSPLLCCLLKLPPLLPPGRLKGEACFFFLPSVFFSCSRSGVSFRKPSIGAVYQS